MKVIVGDPAPIASAAVFLDEVSIGLTGADGSLTVAEVTAGPHTIRAHKDGYVDDSATISVPETTSVTLTLTFIKLGTEVRLSSDKASYAVGETAHITQGLYDGVGTLISGRTVDYTVTLDGVWYAGWGQYSDDPSRDLILSKDGTYTITGNFVGDDTYKPSSKTITITARKIGTSVGLSSDKTSYTAGETAHLTLGLYDEYGSIIDHSKIVDYTVTLNGAWYAGWGQYGDDPARDLILSEAGTYVITGDFPGDDTYDLSSNAITITAITPTYTITIHVEGSGPIEGAEVLLDGVSVGLTDSIGVLTITEVTTGSHTIEARKAGYTPDSTTISVPETTSVTLALARLVYTVTVTVTGSGPIVGAAVYFDGAYVGSTNTAGSITITEVTAGSHTIRASKSGYHDASKTISVPETTSVTLTLAPIAKIRTEVRISSDKTSYTVGETAHITQGLYDDAGNLISGRIVDYTVTRDGAWYAGWGQYSDDPSRGLLLNASGTYVITGSFAGDGTYEPSSNAITITATTAPPPKYTVRVTTYDTDGAYLGGVKVYLDGVYKGTSTATWESITIYGIPKGWHDFKGTKSDYDDALRHEYINRDMSIALHLRPTPPPPPPGFLVTVRVSDTITGKPVVGVRVGFGNYPLKYTDSTGTVEFKDVATGLYALYMDKTGYEYFSQTYYISSDRVIDVGLKPILREPEEGVDYYWDGLNWVCMYCGAASASLDAIIYHIKSKHPEKLV